MMAELYQVAAKCIQNANAKKGSIKTLVYNSSYTNLRLLFALVVQSVKYQSVLKEILSKCGSDFLNDELINNNQEMAIALLYEMLLGNRFGKAGLLRKSMRKYEKEIKAARTEFLKEKGERSLKDIVEPGEIKAIPRYARVNLIKCTVQEAIDKVCWDGWEYVGRLSMDRFQEDVVSLSESHSGQFGLDPLLEDVLVFPINTDLHSYSLVNDGILILQDRASCVPARVLNPPPDSVVLDCCAAPGNKTSHLAGLMRDQGRIIALDLNAKRMSTMRSLLQRTGVSCVEMIVQDFLTLSPESDEVKDITMMLVDPSCSGSGMRGRIDQDACDLNRLETLKRFQISLLKHALRFPNIQRVVYSTCSVHRQENEDVVEEVMRNVSRHFHFVTVLPEWPDSRGLERYKNHKHFLRVSAEKHLTTGFFVACFERIENNTVVKADGENENSEDRVNMRDKENSDCHKVASDGDSVHNENEDLTDALDVEQCHSKSKKKKKKHRDDIDSKHGEGNVDDAGVVMDAHASEDTRDISGKRKKKKKHSKETGEHSIEYAEADSVENIRKKKKERDGDKEVTNVVQEIPLCENMEQSLKKNKSKRENEINEPEVVNLDDNLCESMNHSAKKKKRKRKHKESDEENIVDLTSVEEDGICIKKKKSKHNDKEVSGVEDVNEQPSKKRKKSKKTKGEKETNVSECDNQEVVDVEEEDVNEDVSKKKKKKAKKHKKRKELE